MSTDTIEDRFEKIGQPDGSTDDELSSTPIGNPTVPPETELLAYYPIGGGVPAVMPGWNPEDMSPSGPVVLDFADDGQTVEMVGADGTGATVRGTTAQSASIPFYFEVPVVVEQTNSLAVAIGVVRAEVPLPDSWWDLAPLDAIAVVGDGTITNSDGSITGTGAAYGTGDIVGLLFEPGTGLQVNINGGAFSTLVPFTEPGNWVPFISLGGLEAGGFDGVDGTYTLATLAVDLADLPTGATPWDGPVPAPAPPPAGDPDYANVALLLHGGDFLDHSSNAFVATVGAGVTLDSSIPNGAVGTSSFRVTGVGDPTFTFPACPEFKQSPLVDYTLEYQVLFDAVPANNLAMCSNAGSKFLQFLADGADARITQQGWGPIGSSAEALAVSLSAWHQVTMVYEAAGTKFSFWLDTVQKGTTTFAMALDAVDQDMQVISALGTGGARRMMEIRYTPGVARYHSTDLTIPAQTAPWPDS